MKIKCRYNRTVKKWQPLPLPRKTELEWEIDFKQWAHIIVYNNKNQMITQDIEVALGAAYMKGRIDGWDKGWETGHEEEVLCDYAIDGKMYKDGKEVFPLSRSLFEKE